jgi:hypothetical protein
MSLIMMAVGAYLIIPKIANAEGTITHLTVPVVSYSQQNKSTTCNKTSQKLKNLKVESNIDFVPPNYGGPDSMNGSGTR